MRDDQPFLDAEIDLNDYLDIILQKKWIMITVFLVLFLYGTLINLLTPSEKYYQATAIFENPRVEYLPDPNPQMRIREVLNLENTIVIFRSVPFAKTLFKGTKLKISQNEAQRIIQNHVRLKKIFGTYFFELEVSSKDKERPLAIAQEILKKLEPIANDALKKYTSNFEAQDIIVTNFRIFYPPVMPDRVTKVVPNKKLRTILLLLMSGFLALWSPFIAEFFDRRKHRQIRPFLETIDK